MTWLDYWNGSPTIFVSARHRSLHDESIAQSTIGQLPSPAARVLDFGCGDATGAGSIAETCGHLYLWDASDTVRERLRRRFSGHPKITVVSDGPSGLEPSSLDVAVINSVVQYLSPDDLSAALVQIHRLLAPGGKLVVADVIPHEVGPIEDASALLKYAAKEGFLIATILGLARTAFSNYGSVRAAHGIAKYSQSEFLELLARHGYAAERIAENFGHNQRRMTFVARAAGP